MKWLYNYFWAEKYDMGPLSRLSWFVLFGTYVFIGIIAGMGLNN